MEVISTDLAHFSQIAPYLANPLVLIGFCLLGLSWLYRTLLKAGILTPLSQDQSFSIVRQMLKHSFAVGILVLLLGFALAGYQAYRHSGQQGPVTQRSGDNSSNINGNNNKTDINPPDKTVNPK